MEMFMSHRRSSALEVKCPLCCLALSLTAVLCGLGAGWRHCAGANRLSSVFPGRKRDGGTSTAHTLPHPPGPSVMGDGEKAEEATPHLEPTGTLHQPQTRSNFKPCLQSQFQMSSFHAEASKAFRHSPDDSHTYRWWVGGYPSLFDRSKEAASHLQGGT